MSRTVRNPIGRRAWRAALWAAVLLACPARSVTAEEPAKPSVHFQALWARRAYLINQSARQAVVVQATGEPAAGANRQKTLPVRILARLSHRDERFEPADAELTLFEGASAEGLPKPDEGYWIVMTYEVRQGNRPAELRLQSFVYRETDQVGRYRQRNFLPIDSPEGPLVDAIREMIFDWPVDGKPPDPMERMLHYLGGTARDARDLAASYASVNAMALTASDLDADRRERFAQAVLGTADAPTRRLLAQAYAAAEEDILPNSRPALVGLLGHADAQTFEPVLTYGITGARRRAKDLAPLLRPYLAGPLAAGTDPAVEAARRRAILAGLQGWGREALALRDELEALARGRARFAGVDQPLPIDERLAALVLLLDADAPAADSLVLETLTEIPSAVAMQYACRHRLNAVVPAVIEAVRAGKLRFSASHSAALALLTGRYPEGNFDRFNKWWQGIEQAGQTDAMLENDFVDADAEARARRLIEQLASSTYEQRAEARRKLAELVQPLPPSLRKAQDSSDPEVARSAREIVSAAGERLEQARRELDAQADRERAGERRPRQVEQLMVPAGIIMPNMVGVQGNVQVQLNIMPAEPPATQPGTRPAQ